MVKVFVYGTLKQGHGNHVLLEDSRFLGPAITDKKFIMYRAGIPFVSKSHNTTNISGELYMVDDITLKMLDMLEGHPAWYKRETTKINYINNKGELQTTSAWLYFNEDIPNEAEVLNTGIYGSKGKENKFESLL